MNKFNSIIYMLLLFCNSFSSFGQCSGDITPPVPICKSNFNVVLSPNGFAVVSGFQLDNGSTDNCGISHFLINGQLVDTFYCSDIFATINVTMTVVDTSGNLDSCSTTLNIQDFTPPLVVCNSDTTDFYLPATGPVTVLPQDIGIAVDECGIASETLDGLSSLSFDSSQVGLHIVTFTAVDLAGNLANCMSYINIIDTFRLKTISGNIFHDNNFTCLKDIGEISLSNVIVEAVASNNQSFFGTTDANGDYTIVNLDTGAYTVAPIFVAPYWQTCVGAYAIQITPTSVQDTLDFAAQATTACPFMEVQIAAPFLRRGDNSSYHVSYCNQGTVTANNATVDVTLDPFVTYISSSVPLISQNGNVLTFNIGNVGVNSCGNFSIYVQTSAAAILGQTHCTEAHIYPDSLCVSNLWNGAHLQVQARCLVDTIEFKIKNIGNAPYGPDNYSIFEDHVILNIGNTGVINPNDSIVILEPIAQGKTYRIEVAQQAGFPLLLGNRLAAAGLEHCAPLANGNFNTGIITQFPTNNSSPFISIDCQQNIGSFDPNDKSAQPEGYDNNFHYIYDDTRLNYKIRFQNTGTDTAFNITVIDTLSSLLDLGSIKMGASSHDYTWKLKGNNILEVTFANIMLPDSNVNLALSQGFFHFEIDQKANNPLGAVIYNSAAIYFDINAPIITNTTFHTIDDNFIVVNVAVEEIFEQNIDVLVYPNPFTESTTIKVQGKTYENLQLSLFDITGREVAQTQSSADNQIQLFRNDLLPGVYFYKLNGDNQLITTGKVIVQ